MVDLVTELRKIEGVNTSFDYGVELVVMTVKETVGDWEDLRTAIIDKEMQFAELFKWDRVCGKGFTVAEKWVFDYIHFHKLYLDFIREFKYCNSIYCMISEELITLYLDNDSEIFKKFRIEDLSESIRNAGFTFKYIDKGNEIEFRVLGLVDF